MGRRRASGALFGLAYGDALGAATEFRTVAEIVAEHGPGGPRDLRGDPALVTDDTQMTLPVGEALLRVTTPPALSAERVEPLLRSGFVEWSRSPENNRAPGMTCLEACGRLADGLPWREATNDWSKGCGANMRVVPAGLAPGLADQERAAFAQFQAALTHGHPTALAASELTALAVRWLADGMAPADLPAALREHCRLQRSVYHHDWLGDLWDRPGVPDPATYMALGWDECRSAIDRLVEAVAAPDPSRDPCERTGAGWVAEEALATAVHCLLLHQGSPVDALARAATTSGDSDSIACLTGAFAGAALGMDAWPADWAGRIEYRDELACLAAAWD
ncbi:ADP-ribosylglycohydrolase family protein [Actinoalloteichus caeruleus]|uniref:ADP-ribosylglycohydrolase family protein n=1 Tax=Actinoalloteichus cyanogriseus TaxID=2893586 RepID=UPI003BB89A48